MTGRDWLWWCLAAVAVAALVRWAGRPSPWLQFYETCSATQCAWASQRADEASTQAKREAKWKAKLGKWEAERAAAEAAGVKWEAPAELLFLRSLDKGLSQREAAESEREAAESADEARHALVACQGDCAKGCAGTVEPR